MIALVTIVWTEDDYQSFQTFTEAAALSAYTAWLATKDDRTYTVTTTCSCGAAATEAIDIADRPFLYCRTHAESFRVTCERDARRARAERAASAARAIAYHGHLSQRI